MQMDLLTIPLWITYLLEACGVLFIVGGFALSGALYLKYCRTMTTRAAYQEFRHRTGRSIILGLDFLIAADIIKTILVDNTLISVSILGLVVLIRTFLSMTLHVEVEGCWPWQQWRKKTDTATEVD
jgi:uncharacterized membrane protein